MEAGRGVVSKGTDPARRRYRRRRAYGGEGKIVLTLTSSSTCRSAGAGLRRGSTSWAVDRSRSRRSPSSSLRVLSASGSHRRPRRLSRPSWSTPDRRRSKGCLDPRGRGRTVARHARHDGRRRGPDRQGRCPRLATHPWWIPSPRRDRRSPPTGPDQRMADADEPPAPLERLRRWPWGSSPSATRSASSAPSTPRG